MATVHPSRLGLVPQDPKDRHPVSREDRRRPPSPQYPRRRTPSRERERDSEYRRDDVRKDRSRSRDGDRERGGESSRRYERERGRADDYFDDDGERARRRSRSRSVGRERDRERDREREERRERDRARRASPEYSEYRRPSPPVRVREDAPPAPWRQPENMYPRGRDRFPHAGYGGGADFMESRRQQRESNTLTIWPPSPKAPARDFSPSSDSKRRGKKSHKRRYDDTDDSSDTDSDEEERRRRRKERKKARKEKEKPREKDRNRERSRRSHRSRSRRYSDEGSEDDRDRRRSKGDDRRRSEDRDRRRSNTRTKSPEPRPPSTEPEADEDEWVEKPVATGILAPAAPSAHAVGSPPKAATSSSAIAAPSASDAQPADDSDEEVGPQPVYKAQTSRKVDERQYGGALLRGEGSAMAAFLRDGTDQRIPRRGEIGLASDEIASFEAVGYVMSGSRHRRMNAVRMRKENQVISAEEKRGILKLQQEERERREAILREEFQQLVNEKLKSQGTAK
ncbi:DUF926-domain-containing protein [Wolfiporia cocos MD-104 SS10]|uniref:DUF926-domain-containing protein n=1 Tax=Wolfiporia cocos (strain MD-104) TaxID=742152 RepID=A0A2H3J1G5_WOLCO|nr:DUF926-domain-containing protein [Wolfiporia cocos MD-104 SS10]